MTLTKTLFGAAFSMLATAQFAFANDIMIMDPYAISAGKMAKAGAAFMMIHNMGDQDDRLIDVQSDVSAKVELHTHVDQGGGVMKMVHVAEGFVIPAHDEHVLKRGSDHVMFMGLKVPFEQGAMIDLTLIFEHAGEVHVQVPVDLTRLEGDKMDHSKMDHSTMAPKSN